MVDTRTPSSTRSRPRPKRSRPWLIALALAMVAVGGGLVWFFGGDAPGEVDLVETATAITDGSDVVTSAVTLTGIEGTWLVDTTVGDFTVTEDTAATFAGFRVEEVLTSIGSTTAVGRSPSVSGTIEIDGTTLTSAELVVDLTSVVSDESRREDAIQRALGTGSNPSASFVLTEPIELGDAAASGELVSVIAVGELTLNGVANTVDIPLEAQLVDGMILVTGSSDILFADYEVTAPSAPVVVSVEDNGIFEFQLWLSR